jgi:hypothetical protein
MIKQSSKPTIGIRSAIRRRDAGCQSRIGERQDRLASNHTHKQRHLTRRQVHAVWQGQLLIANQQDIAVLALGDDSGDGFACTQA